MNYWKLKHLPLASERRRAVKNLERLRAQLSDEIPAKDAEGNLLLATWNIRDLGKLGGGFGYGPRLPESYFYIAEIISRFDFVAIQEVNQIEAWQMVMAALGPHWDYIASDVTDKDLGGNGERLVYVYDTRKVSFRNIVGQIVLPPALLVSPNVKAKRGDKPKKKSYRLETVGRQFARTPYFASFQAGWRKFDICTVHIYYGSESGEKLEERIVEIQRVASYLGEKAQEAIEKDKTLILLGDFNVVGLKHKTMDALLESGFEVPALLQEPPGKKRNSYYDQIAFRTKEGSLDYLGNGDEANKLAGSFKIFDKVFADDQWNSYRKDFESVKKLAKGKDPQAYFRKWRTWQLSDHQPLWVRLRADDADNYLKTLVTPKANP
jgi:endonuclease/exonuclease/phosphatase family metal-dependent hydrolase